MDDVFSVVSFVFGVGGFDFNYLLFMFMLLFFREKKEEFLKERDNKVRGGNVLGFDYVR